MRYVVVSVLVALLLLGACASGSGETTGDGAAAGAVDDGKGSSDTAGADDASGGPAGGGALDKIKSIMGLKVKYTADYDINAPDAPKMTQTWAFDLPRMAIKGTTSGSESWTIVDTNQVTVCTKINAAWQCFKSSSGEAPTNPSDSLSASLDEQPDVALAGSCTRAGETGVKYKVSTDEMDSTVCYTVDGILLESSTTANGQTMSMVATKVVRSVSEKDFTPPAEVVDMAEFQKKMMADAGLPEGFEIPTS